MSNLIPEVPTRAATAKVLKYLRAQRDTHPTHSIEKEEFEIYEYVREHPRVTNEEMRRDLGEWAVERIGWMVDEGLLISEGFHDWPHERRLVSVAAPWVETLKANGIRLNGGHWTVDHKFPRADS